ncbi:titin-like [Pyxicephalus adspersus]|uniref:titin-like n=1 Tax=Pyxicephalus adspersus TaxID=30357 RepID=UPI003B58F8A6
MEFSDDMIHELKKIGGTPDWLAQYHGAPVIHSAYTSRGHFFHENKSFLLEHLTKEDSGLYEQWVNHVTLIQVFLHVIDPVPQPTLTRQENDTGSCLLHLQCLHSGGDQYTSTFLIDGEERNGNITRNSEFSILTLDGANPQDWGTYTCNVSNIFSWNISEELLVKPEGIPEEQLTFHIITTGLGVYVVFLITQALWKIKQLNGKCY